MVKVLDYYLEVSEYKLQSCYYVHFWTNAHGKGFEHPYFPCSRLNNISAILLPLALIQHHRLICH